MKRDAEPHACRAWPIARRTCSEALDLEHVSNGATNRRVILAARVSRAARGTRKSSPARRSRLIPMGSLAAALYAANCSGG